MSNNTKPVLDDIASLAQAYRDACSEADTLLAENQRLSAELAEARKHAKVLADAIADKAVATNNNSNGYVENVVVDGAIIALQQGPSENGWTREELRVVSWTFAFDAALKWAKEQP